MPSDLKAPPLGLYIHIPWCVRKCPYCDFNSHAVDAALPEGQYGAALLADLEQDLPLVEGRTLQSIFIGGGTPSLFSPQAIQWLLTAVQNRLACAPGLEITLEANPGTVESDRFVGFRQAGVNRLSLGVQSFQDAPLRALGRIHGGEEAARAVEMAKAAGFTNFNLDLMFGLPGQTVDGALKDIQTAIALQPAHISFYQLTLEPNTVFYKYPPPLPEDETLWQIQKHGQAQLEEHGYQHYEVSAYGRHGFACRHNVNYWQFGDYLGIGAGAHGKITNLERQTIDRLWKVKRPGHYMKTAGTAECIGGKSTIDPRHLPLEFLMNNLRLKQGFRAEQFEERTGLPLEALEPALSECVEEGLLIKQNGCIGCTETGWNFLNEVLERFMP